MTALGGKFYYYSHFTEGKSRNPKAWKGSLNLRLYKLVNGAKITQRVWSPEFVLLTILLYHIRKYTTHGLGGMGVKTLRGTYLQEREAKTRTLITWDGRTFGRVLRHLLAREGSGALGLGGAAVLPSCPAPQFWSASPLGDVELPCLERQPAQGFPHCLCFWGHFQSLQEGCGPEERRKESRSPGSAGRGGILVMRPGATWPVDRPLRGPPASEPDSPTTSRGISPASHRL